MKEAYITKRFAAPSLQRIEQANEIIQEYMADDLNLTLRQLYYQFVSRGLLPNNQKEYKNLGSLISDARLAGLIDWEAIEDRTRNLRGNSHWEDPGAIIRSARWSFKLDHWNNQEYRIEVWIEKEALIGVVASICQRLDVPYFACKGYVSQSEAWRAGKRFIEYLDRGQHPIIIYLGDHDPSGLDMTRDIQDRMDMFSSAVTEPDYTIKVERIALNMDQIEQYNPPPNPAKLTDSRSSSYVTRWGRESWELDALEPRILTTLIEDTVLYYRDSDKYEATIELENQYVDILKSIEQNWRKL